MKSPGRTRKPSTVEDREHVRQRLWSIVDRLREETRFRGTTLATLERLIAEALQPLEDAEPLTEYLRTLKTAGLREAVSRVELLQRARQTGVVHAPKALTRLLERESRRAARLAQQLAGLPTIPTKDGADDADR